MATEFSRKTANFDFQVVSCIGASPPKVAFHTCSIAQHKCYIFGGLDDKKCVQNGLFCFDPTGNEWTELSEVGSCLQKCDLKAGKFGGVRIQEAPNLSHHTANVLGERFIVFIGGWTGRKRSSDVFYYDTMGHTWFQIHVKGDIPAGLSSHTATLVSDAEILILGREGGVRTHRRSGDSFYFNVKTGTYKESDVAVSSRSGHTTNLVKSNLGRGYVLFVYGGRKGSEYQLTGSWSKNPQQKAVLPNDKISNFLSNWLECDKPSGRQHCVSVGLSDKYLLFFGGETWGGVRNNVTNEMYVLDCSAMRWYRPELGDGVPCLTGHTMGLVGDRVYVLGGLSHRKCSDGVWMVTF